MITSVYNFINELRERKIYFELGNVRESAIMCKVDVPGQRWEIEFFENGDVEIEIFKSDGNIYDKEMIQQLYKEFSD